MRAPIMLCVFAVYDAAAGAYMEPFCAPTAEMAIRGFREACNAKGKPFNTFPEDFTLFQLGEFDQSTGKLLGLTAPHSLGVALTYIERYSHADVRLTDDEFRSIPETHPLREEMEKIEDA